MDIHFNRKTVLSLIMILLVLAACYCGASYGADVITDNIVSKDSSKEKEKTDNSGIKEPSKTKAMDSEKKENQGKQEPEDTKEEEKKPLTFDDYVKMIDETVTSEAPKVLKADNPSLSYYIKEGYEAYEVSPFSIKTVSDERNSEITEEDWYKTAAPEGILWKDKKPSVYAGVMVFDHNSGRDSSSVDIYRDGKLDKNISFADYLISYEEIPEEKDRILQEPIRSFLIQGSILYVSTCHMQYSQACPTNGYITAYDLEKEEIIWKSEPLVCNSGNFVIAGDIIFAGYGIPSEGSYLNQINKHSGKVIAKEKLRSRPRILSAGEDGVLYLHCSSRDYIFNYS